MTWSGSPLRIAMPAILLSVLLLAPFLDKAFTIDDPLFLFQAQHNATDPLHPGAYIVVWSEDVPVRASVAFPVTGPVMGYLLVPAILLSHLSEFAAEIVAHLIQMVLLCAAAYFTVLLALRLGYEPWRASIAACLLVTAPAVLGMAGTAMPDVAALAFGVMAVERYSAWRSEPRWGLGAAAALLLTIAILTRSHMVVLLLVLALPPVLERFTSRRAREPWWPPLAVACVMLTLFVALQDRSPASAQALPLFKELFNPYWIPRNLIAFGANWVLAFPVGLGWLALRWRSMYWLVAGGMSAALIMPIPQSVPRWSAPVAVLGLIVLADVLRLSWERRDWGRLSLGLWLLAGLVTLPYPHHPAKYEVPAMAAAALLLAGELPSTSRRWVLAAVAALVLCGAWLGTAINRADSASAGRSRWAAAELIRPEVARGDTVWFTGHWGLEWYAQKAGARPITRTTPFPKPGDLVVATNVDECQALTYIPHRVLLASYKSTKEGGWAMSKKTGAGFFSNVWGFLPWSWGRDEIGRFEVWRVE